jgi:undecaprenyl-diphosphatase
MSSAPHAVNAKPTLTQAIWLGALHGPAELLPISSSAHVELIPWLLGSSYSELGPELRKSFDVALHGGAAAAMLIACRGELREAMNPARLRFIALATLPAALAGALLEDLVQRHLGGPRQMAGGLLAGALAMLATDRCPEHRSAASAGTADALAVGAGQALALIPGVSRAAASLSVARLRGFARAEAARLSRQVALPVIAGAVALKGARLARGELTPGALAPMAAGTLSSFASARACAGLAHALERRRALSALAAYRIALAGLVLLRASRHPACRPGLSAPRRPTSAAPSTIRA